MNYFWKLYCLKNLIILGATVSVSGSGCPAAIPHDTHDMKIAINGYNGYTFVSNIQSNIVPKMQTIQYT